METKHRVILIAIDPSKFSEYALENAIGLMKEGDRLVLLHVSEIQQTSLLDPLHEPLDRLWNYEQREKAKKLIEEFGKICHERGVKNYEYRNIEAEDAREAICKEAEEIKADMLVMGSRGLGYIKRMLLGSVSSYCVQHAPCPVLIVRGNVEHKE